MVEVSAAVGRVVEAQAEAAMAMAVAVATQVVEAQAVARAAVAMVVVQTRGNQMPCWVGHPDENL